jgi:hypothetical protein
MTQKRATSFVAALLKFFYFPYYLIPAVLFVSAWDSSVASQPEAEQ